MDTRMLRAIAEDNEGKLPMFTWPGGYPIVYFTMDGGDLCPACANNANGSMAFIPAFPPGSISKSDRQWALAYCLIHYEGEPIVCDHCGTEIESAYGPVDSEG